MYSTNFGVCVLRLMEGVIEISSDEEEDAKPSKGTKRSLVPEVIIISSHSAVS